MMADGRELRRPPSRRFCVAYSSWLVATIVWLAVDVSDPSLLFLVLLFAFAMPIAGIAVAIAWLALPIWGLAKAIGAARRYELRSALVYFSAPVVAAIIVPGGRIMAENIRFEIERRHYLAMVETARAGGTVPWGQIDLGPPVFAYFNWGGMIWASKGIAYDESDEAGKPDTERSETWRARRRNSEISCDAGVRHLTGHFYMVHAGC